MSGRTTVTCERCNDTRDAAEDDEYGHVCDDWWDEHGIFDALPMQRVEWHPGSAELSSSEPESTIDRAGSTGTEDHTNGRSE